MRVAIAGAARAVSAKVVRADIAVTPAGSAAAGRRTEKLKGPPQVDNYHFFSFLVSLLYLTKTSFLNRIAMEKEKT